MLINDIVCWVDKYQPPPPRISSPASPSLRLGDVFLENDKTYLHQFIFQGLGENTFSLQPALKSNALSL